MLKAIPARENLSLQGKEEVKRVLTKIIFNSCENCKICEKLDKNWKICWINQTAIFCGNCEISNEKKWENSLKLQKIKNLI